MRYGSVILTILILTVIPSLTLIYHLDDIFWRGVDSHAGEGIFSDYVIFLNDYLDGQDSANVTFDAPKFGKYEIKLLCKTKEKGWLKVSINDSPNPTVSIENKDWEWISLGLYPLGKGQNQISVRHSGKKNSYLYLKAIEVGGKRYNIDDMKIRGVEVPKGEKIIKDKVVFWDDYWMSDDSATVIFNAPENGKYTIFAKCKLATPEDGEYDDLDEGYLQPEINGSIKDLVTITNKEWRWIPLGKYYMKKGPHKVLVCQRSRDILGYSYIYMKEIKIIDDEEFSFMDPDLEVALLNADLKIVCGKNAPITDYECAYQIKEFLWNDLAVKSEIIMDTDVNEKILKKNLILVGGPAVNSLSSRINNRIYPRFIKIDDSWSIDGKEGIETGWNTGLISMVDNPNNPNNKFLVIAGTDRGGTIKAKDGFLSGKLNTVIK